MGKNFKLSAPESDDNNRWRRKKRRNTAQRRKKKARRIERKEDSGVRKLLNSGTESETVPPAQTHPIPVKRLVEVEMKLAYGDNQDITHELAKSIASQLMCQASEIVGPPSGPNLGFLPQIDKWVDVALRDADWYYRQKKYVIAASRFTALELYSKGVALEDSFDASNEDICGVVGFIESRLVACYLKLRRPDLALNHTHRSIYHNPVNFQNHIQQAAVFRLLGCPCEAARSAMIADYVYWLSGGTDDSVCKLIKLYWQGMLEESMRAEEAFCAMYTPCQGIPSAEKIAEAKELFMKQHPSHTDTGYTDPNGGHILPQTTDWSKPDPQTHFLTLGFRRLENEEFLDKLLTRQCPAFIGRTSLFAPLSTEEAESMRQILPVLNFIRSTKLAAGFWPGSALVQMLQYASYLGHLHRAEEQHLVKCQALAELAVAPYLQDISQDELLQALMTDAMATLEGRRNDNERVWNEMHKDLAYQLEEEYLRSKGRKVTSEGQSGCSRKRRAPADPECTASLQTAGEGPSHHGHDRPILKRLVIRLR